MGQGSGLGSQMTLAKETTYGTVVNPTAALEYISESLALAPTYVESGGLRAARTAQPASRSKMTNRQAAGQTPMEWPTKGGGKLLDLLHGAVVAPVQQGGTPAYLQAHPIGTSLQNKSASVQLNKPDNTGTDRAFTYPGSMITAWEFALEQGGVVMFTPTWDCRDEVTNVALQTPVYPSGLDSIDYLDALQLTLAGSPVVSVKSARVRGTHPLATDRFFLGSGGLKAKPIPNGFVQMEIELDCEFEGLAAYNLWVAGAATNGIVLDCQGDVISGANKYQLKFDAPACQLRAASPLVQGPDIVQQRIVAKILDNTTQAPLTISAMSTDTALTV